MIGNLIGQRHLPQNAEPEDISFAKETSVIPDKCDRSILNGQSSSINGSNSDHNTPTPMKIKWTPKAYSDSEEEEDVIPSIPTASMTPPSLKVVWDPSKAMAASDSESDDDIAIPNKWKVKQVPDETVDEQEENIVPQNKWKVKQVPDEAASNVIQNKWKVKQVPDQTVEEEQEEEEEVSVVPPQNKWKVKQVPDETVEEESIVPQNKWKVKQVPDETPSLSGEDPRPQGGGQGVASPILSHRTTQASVQRSSTFTKVDRKMVKPRLGQQSGLKMKWAPKSATPSSSEEDLSQRPPSRERDGDEGEGEPNFTSYPTLPRPGKEKGQQETPTRQSPIQSTPTQRGVSPVRHMTPTQRGMSPVRHGTSPLQYNRKSEASIRTSRSPSPSPVPLTPPTSTGLRPPSPRGTVNRSPTATTTTTGIRRQLPTPGALKSPRQQLTPPTKSGLGYQSTRQQGRVAQRSPVSTAAGGKRLSGLVAPSGQKGQGLISPSSRSPGQQWQGIPVSKPIRGGATNQQRKVPRQPKPSANTSDDGWLDDCY